MELLPTHSNSLKNNFKNIVSYKVYSDLLQLNQYCKVKAAQLRGSGATRSVGGGGGSGGAAMGGPP